MFSQYNVPITSPAISNHLTEMENRLQFKKTRLILNQWIKNQITVSAIVTFTWNAEQTSVPCASYISVFFFFSLISFNEQFSLRTKRSRSLFRARFNFRAAESPTETLATQATNSSTCSFRTHSGILRTGSFEVNWKMKGLIYLSKYAACRYEIKQRNETYYEGSFWFRFFTIGNTWLIKVSNFDITV